MEEIELLKRALEIYSPSGQEREMGAYLVAEMAKRGFSASIDGAGNAVGILGSGEREILLLGHMDTVQGFIPVREENGNLFGRGAVDAKGPLCTFIEAAARLDEQSLAHKRIVIVAAVEEECPTSKGAHFILDRYNPAYVIVGEPSGWEGITLGYKGRVRLSYLISKDAAHNAASTKTAAEDAVEFWSKLADVAASFNVGQRVFDQLDCSLLRINSHNDGLTDNASLQVDIRTPVGFDHSLLSAFVDSYPDIGASIKLEGEVPAFRAPKNNPLVRAFVRAIRAHHGEPRFKLKTGTSDMNLAGEKWNVPMVAYGPGDSSLDHTPREFIELGEYQRAISVLASVLRQL
jgi:LysW-gamma-L-lysine carboxypeptidase